MLERLDGKTVLITGAAGGIGSETARVCAQLGAQLVLVDTVAPAALAQEINKLWGVRADAFALDVRDRPATEQLIAQLERLDAVVASAAICPWDDWDDADWDEVCQRVLDINVHGVMHLSRAAMKKMAAPAGGKLVLVSSLAARMGGLKASPHYVASKGAISSLLKWLARKGAPDGINVNCVAPGAADTGMTQSTSLDVSGVPMRRMATPREIALPIAFLCTRGADYICGATLDVNGGAYMA